MPRILIIGFGLMGGSVGMALRRRGWHVRYVDERVSFERAAAAEAADEKLDAVRDEEIVLLATHVDAAVETLRALRVTGLITSVCSVMRPLRAVAPENFIAGHPMAGSQRSGFEAATPQLFEGKNWFLEREDPRLRRMVSDCGAFPRVVDAERHDAAVALSSHLPQVLATAVASYLYDREDVIEFAGSGLRDMLRIAGSSADMWAPILEANRDQLAPHADAIAAIVREIIDGDPAEAFAKARAVWRALEERWRM